jgi:hypothetical protein
VPIPQRVAAGNRYLVLAPSSDRRRLLSKHVYSISADLPSPVTYR